MNDIRNKIFNDSCYIMYYFSIQIHNDTYGNVQVVEYKSVGRDNSILLNQIITRKILAHVFVIRGFKGRTIAMYLQIEQIRREYKYRNK